nr:hypothetical protein GCM10020092_025500 [Actinoplanes digitatis]
MVAGALLRHQLAVLLLRIALLTDSADGFGGTTTSESRTFARFRRDLEDGHPHSRRVEDYAARIGCSVRTLTRACLAVTGRSAKRVVDDRVALEAQRLLACTDLSVAEIGRAARIRRADQLRALLPPRGRAQPGRVPDRRGDADARPGARRRGRHRGPGPRSATG